MKCGVFLAELCIYNTVIKIIVKEQLKRAMIIIVQNIQKIKLRTFNCSFLIFTIIECNVEHYFDYEMQIFV